MASTHCRLALFCITLVLCYANAQTVAADGAAVVEGSTIAPSAAESARLKVKAQEVLQTNGPMIMQHDSPQHIELWKQALSEALPNAPPLAPPKGQPAVAAGPAPVGGRRLKVAAWGTKMYSLLYYPNFEQSVKPGR